MGQTKFKINPTIIEMAQEEVRKALQNNQTGEIKMPKPLDTLLIVINQKPEKFLAPIVVPEDLSEKVNSIHIITDLKKK